MRTTAAILALWLAAGTASAADVDVRLASSAVYQGEVARVTVEIRASKDPVKSIGLDAPAGFSVDGPFGGVQKTTVANGVRTSSVEVGFRVTAPADAEGEYVIGPLHVTRRSGKTEEYPVGKLTVGRRPHRGVRFTVDAVPPAGPVGMPFVARYRILYSGKPYADEDVFGQANHPLGLTSLSLPVLKSSDVRAEPVDVQDATRIRLSKSTTLSIVRGSANTPDGVFRTLEFSLRITPLVIGDVDLSASAGLALVDRTEQKRDFFGGIVEVPVAHEYQASTGAAVYHVKSLPEEGKPRGFSGAVGRYRITAVPEPTTVNAYDPIDVTVTITGEGVLEKVSLPRYSNEPDVARDFEVDTDVDPGKVVGDSRVFHVVFRPRSSAVTALPALRFPYFDPWKGKYEVAVSSPVPLTVRDVKTVRVEDAVGAPTRPDTAPTPAERTPIAALSGIGAIYRDLDGTKGELRARPPLMTPGFLALLVLPPLVAAAAFLAVLARRRPKDLPKGSALSEALAALAAAKDPDAAAAAVAGYFRRRLDLPEGEVTAKELLRALTARVVPEPVIERTTGLWEAFEAARFAGGGEPPAAAEETLREVDRCLS